MLSLWSSLIHKADILTKSPTGLPVSKHIQSATLSRLGCDTALSWLRFHISTDGWGTHMLGCTGLSAQLRLNIKVFKTQKLNGSSSWGRHDSLSSWPLWALCPYSQFTKFYEYLQIGLGVSISSIYSFNHLIWIIFAFKFSYILVVLIL